MLHRKQTSRPQGLKLISMSLLNPGPQPLKQAETLSSTTLFSDSHVLAELGCALHLPKPLCALLSVSPPPVSFEH